MKKRLGTCKEEAADARGEGENHQKVQLLLKQYKLAKVIGLKA